MSARGTCAEDDDARATLPRGLRGMDGGAGEAVSVRGAVRRVTARVPVYPKKKQPARYAHVRDARQALTVHRSRRRRYRSTLSARLEGNYAHFIGGERQIKNKTETS